MINSREDKEGNIRWEITGKTNELLLIIPLTLTEI